MPTAYIKKLAKLNHTTVDKIEKFWSQAKEIAKSEGQGKAWGLITTIFQNKLKKEGYKVKSAKSNKQFSYKGKIITACSKEEAIHQILSAHLFESTINDITFIPLNIDKEKVINGILSILFKPNTASLSFADSNGNNVNKQISYESFEDCAKQVTDFVNSNWNRLETIFKDNKDKYLNDEKEKARLKNAAKNKKLITYERNKETIVNV